MYTMYTRVSVSVVVVAAVLGLAACGGNKSGGTSASSYMPGTMSVPNSATDPCNQKDMNCTPTHPGYVAVSMCQQTGTWSTMCQCVLATSLSGAGGGATGGGSCGNGVIDAAKGEKCDGMNLGGASCASLVPGSSGVLRCSPTTCNYDMSMCHTGTGVGGAPH